MEDDVNNKQEGYIELDGEKVSIAARKAYDYELAIRNYWNSAEMSVHREEANAFATGKKEVPIYGKKWFFFKNFNNQVGFKYQETFDHEAFFDKWEELSGFPWRHIEREDIKYWKRFFDLKGKVLLTLEQYQKLKEYIYE